MTSHPENRILDERIKAKVYQMYEKPSAYRSGMLVKLYKEAGGTYSGNRTDKEELSRWYKEKQKNQRGEIGYKSKSDVYRPTVKVSKDTPETFQELTKKEIERARREKANQGIVHKFKQQT